VSAEESRWLAIAIPISELILIKCYFFLDTIFLGFYTFVNCKVSLAGSMSTRQRENRNNGNQESSSKEASEEGSQENSKEEVSRQRNRQHNRGTPKASPDVFLLNAVSSVFMRFPRTSHAGKNFSGLVGVDDHTRGNASMKSIFPEISVSGCPRFCRWRLVTSHSWVAGKTGKAQKARASARVVFGDERPHLLPKWYWAMPPLDERVKR
jgi:hypothetical protein